MYLAWERKKLHCVEQKTVDSEEADVVVNVVFVERAAGCGMRVVGWEQVAVQGREAVAELLMVVEAAVVAAAGLKGRQDERHPMGIRCTI